MSLLNESETRKIFFESVNNCHNISNSNGTTNINLAEVKKDHNLQTACQKIENVSQINSLTLNFRDNSLQTTPLNQDEDASNTNISEKSDYPVKIKKSHKVINKFTINNKSITTKNDLTISPKSAFVKMK